VVRDAKDIENEREGLYKRREPPLSLPLSLEAYAERVHAHTQIHAYAYTRACAYTDRLLGDDGGHEKVGQTLVIREV
jgi:hypothetical protein